MRVLLIRYEAKVASKMDRLLFLYSPNYYRQILFHFRQSFVRSRAVFICRKVLKRLRQLKTAATEITIHLSLVKFVKEPFLLLELRSFI
jgi:hypothetical protein